MLTKIGGLGILNTELTKFFSQFVITESYSFIDRYQQARNRKEVDTCSILTRLTGMWSPLNLVALNVNAIILFVHTKSD